MEDSVPADRDRTTEDLLSADEPADASDDGGVSRKKATLFISPFLFIGLANLILLLGWGLDPLWGFMIFPPILFVTVLGWIAFRTGFASDRGE